MAPAPAQILVLMLALLAGWAQAGETVSHPFVGVTCIDRTEASPRPLRMHIVDIDLAAPGLRFRLTPASGPAHTRKQTTLQYLAEQHAQIAVNAHFFEPWPPPAPDPGTASLVGIAASDGHVYSPFMGNPPKPYAIHANAPGLNIDADNHASIVHRRPSDATGYAASEPVTLYNTVSGNEQIIANGVVSAAQNNWNNQLSPRTIIGLTRKNHLILFIVDGRQKGVSEGMKVPEAAELLAKDYEVADAIDLDGGGSTTLAIADPVPRVVNVPVGINDTPGTQRPVGSSLAVFAMAGQASAPAQSGPSSSSAVQKPGASAAWTFPAIWAIPILAVFLAAALAVWAGRRRRLRQ